MPPKKAAVAAVSADPSPAEASPEQKAETKTDASTQPKIADHPTVRNMVLEAFKMLDSRKGVSNQAIQNYIKRKWLMNPARLKHLVRKELTKGLENGWYVRPPGSTVTTGITGKFRLASKIKIAKSKAEIVDPNVEKAPKVAKDGAKKKKTGDQKKDAASKDKSKEPKPPKMAKKAEEASSSKVAPAKKLKAIKAEPKEGKGASDAAKPKTKAPKMAKEEKASQSKAAKADVPVSRGSGKRGKKTEE